MFRSRVAPGAALAVGLVWAAGSVAQPPARPVAQPAPAVARAGLPQVPPSATAFVSLKVSDLAKHPDLKAVAADLVKHPDALAPLTEAVGLSPLEIDRVTLFWPRLGRDAMAPVMVVTTAEPFNEARLLRNLRAEPVFADAPRRFGPWGGGFGGPAAAPLRAEEWKKDFEKAKEVEFEEVMEPRPPRPLEKKQDGDGASDCSGAAPAADSSDPIFYAVYTGPFDALLLVDERTLLFLPTGNRDAELVVLGLLGAQLKKGTGPLTAALAAADKHTLAAGVHLPPLFREFNRGVGRELVPYTALLSARTAVLTGDLGKTARIALTLTFDDPAAARRAAPVLEEGIAAVTEPVERLLISDLQSEGPVGRAFAPLVAAANDGLKKTSVKAEAATVVATAELDLGPPAAKALGAVVESVRAQARAKARLNNLKRIGLALHNYESANGMFPANVYGPKGELLLSWRVQILPYLDDEDATDLARQIKMNEPWDSAHNKKLIEKMPRVFAAPDREHKPGETYYQGFVRRNKLIPLHSRPGRPWLTEGDRNGARIGGILDGTSNTLAVIEAADGVIWSKPDDLPFGGAVPKLGAKGWEHTPALMFDGRTVLFPTGMRAAQFWPFVTVDGGEPVPDPETVIGPFGPVPRPKGDKAPAPFPKGFEMGPKGKGPPGAGLEEVISLLNQSADDARDLELRVRVAEVLVDRTRQAVAKQAAAPQDLAAAESELALSQARLAVARSKVDSLRRRVEELRAVEVPRPKPR